MEKKKRWESRREGEREWKDGRENGKIMNQITNSYINRTVVVVCTL